MVFAELEIFLSTLPARGATELQMGMKADSLNFYPRSPRGERPGTPAATPGRRNFYPRSPRGERQTLWYNIVTRTEFLSTLPARGATPGCGNPAPSRSISIHAPREGSDVPVTSMTGRAGK